MKELSGMGGQSITEHEFISGILQTFGIENTNANYAGMRHVVSVAFRGYSVAAGVVVVDAAALEYNPSASIGLSAKHLVSTLTKWS